MLTSRIFAGSSELKYQPTGAVLFCRIVKIWQEPLPARDSRNLNFSPKRLTDQLCHSKGHMNIRPANSNGN
jgi:hypothetical protein